VTLQMTNPTSKFLSPITDFKSNLLTN